MLYDLIIIGGGPAGVAAGVYAARKRLKTRLITKEFGGQSIVSPDIQNWIGTKSISGDDLAEDFEEHLRAYQGEYLDIDEGTKVTDVLESDDAFSVKTDDESHQSKAVLVTSGSHRRQLSVPGADEFEHKGLTYCASCDGPLFADQDVAVIGGGNAGFETAAQLLAYTKSVTLLHHREEYKGDKITVEKVLQNPHMRAITNAQTTEILGNDMVTGLKYKDKNTGEEHTLDVTGVFVEIGSIPTTKFVADIVELDEYNRIKIDPWTQKTSRDCIWAAGDCTNVRYHQNNIAAGDGVRALEDIYLHLNA